MKKRIKKKKKYNKVIRIRGYYLAINVSCDCYNILKDCIETEIHQFYQNKNIKRLIHRKYLEYVRKKYLHRPSSHFINDLAKELFAETQKHSFNLSPEENSKEIE